MMFNRKLLLLTLTGILLAPGFAEATLIKAFSLQELHRTADVVITGKVTDANSFWNQTHDTIYTDYTVVVEEAAKGELLKTVTVRLMGGAVGDRELLVSGNAVLEVGERVLLCLRANDGFHTLVGMSQGKWSVRRHGGVNHVFRGAALGSLPRQDGEIPLHELLEEMTGGETR